MEGHGSEKAGMKHVKNDKVMGMKDLWEAQKEINGHVAMLIKIFNIEKNRDHVIGPEEMPILGWGRRKRPQTKMGST